MANINFNKYIICLYNNLHANDFKVVKSYGVLRIKDTVHYDQEETIFHNKSS